MLILTCLSLILIFLGIVSQRNVSRRRATVDYITNLINDRDYIQARQKFIKIGANPEKITALANFIEPSSEEALAVQLVLNNYELITIGIHRGVLDYKIYKRYAKGTVIKDWDVTAPFIKQLRLTADNDNIYAEFETLVNLMQGKAKLNIYSRFLVLFF